MFAANNDLNPSPFTGVFAQMEEIGRDMSKFKEN
ncbi:hypothetical protein PALU110988_21905 [Paenibacillus lupini]|nr:hypothetical protein [Paenibacillus lupini]